MTYTCKKEKKCQTRNIYEKCLNLRGNFMEENTGGRKHAMLTTSYIIKNEVTIISIRMAKIQTLTKANASKDVKQQELSYIVGKNAKRYSHF